MAEEAGRAGVKIIAHDVLDAGLPQAFAGRFDIALAIAVLEHVPDFKGAVEAALKLLRPGGLLLFEVPLIKSQDDIWFRSSLEHIHYPTECSLEFLFRDILGLPLVGSAIEIQDYGYVYVGLTSRSFDVAREAGAEFVRITSAAPETLSDEEAHFRFLFDLIHAAKVSPEILKLLPRLKPEDLSPLTLRRICELWSARERRLEDLETYHQEVKSARDWHAKQTEYKAAEVRELENSIRELKESWSWRVTRLLRSFGK
jgi:SAM-dependent methyltransferase